ncbi:hypothetical protein ACHAXA_004505 [Cyclostephanos tholiformis]|uniref:Lipoyl-binding domain-containing protein n=1 Tax=Cyclostephanos tholiformis TaxID=382380 RepID=A0ABD3RDX2_9STRA
MLVSALPSRISSIAPTPSRLLFNHIARGCAAITNDLAPSSSSPPLRYTPSHPFSSSCSHPDPPRLTTTTTTTPTIILRRAVSTTGPILAQITVNVPSMGDSITEGTIVEWCAPPGSHVKEGDVLCLVETDKVTVDIKADRDGILIRQLGEVEGVVEVGQGLYVMETDAGAMTAAEAAGGESTADVSAVDASLDAGMAAAAMTSSSLSSPPRRKSIQFLGKEGWKARMTRIDDRPAAPAVAAAAAAAATTTTTTTSTVFPTSRGSPNAPTSITHIPYSPMLGRPAITDEEMMSLMLGGADEAPNVIGGGRYGGGSFEGGKVVTAGPRGVWLAA